MWSGEREREATESSNNKSQVSNRKEPRKRRREGRGGTAGGGLGLKRGGEGKRTRRRWGAEEEEEEEEEWGQNWFAFFSLPLSPNRTQSLRDPEGRGGRKGKEKGRRTPKEERKEGRKEGRGDSAGCVSFGPFFPPSSPQQAPFPSLLPLRPQIEASTPTPLPPFFCHKPFLPSFLPFFLLPSRLQHPRPPTPSPKKGGAKEKEAEECRGNFWGWLLPPPLFFWRKEGRKWGEEAGSTPGERPCNVVGGKTQGREGKEEEEEGENKEASFFAPPLLPPSSF